MQAIILAAGKGTRMRSELPKVLHQVLGEPLLQHVLKTLKSQGVRKPHIIAGSGYDHVCSFVKECAKELKIQPVILPQKVQRGTGHAVMMAEKGLGRTKEDILIWPGDMPLLKEETLKQFVREHKKEKAAVSVLSCLRVDPTSYGRILRAGGQFCGIREELDASEAERRIQEVNTGVYLVKGSELFKALKKIKPANKKNELYLTDIIEVLGRDNKKLCAFPLALSNEGQGINNRVDLAEAIKIMNEREIQKHMENGVTFVSPEQTYVEKGAVIGADTVVYPWTFIERNVKIGKKCSIGPFAKIRKGSTIQDGSAVGSFVEVNRSQLGKQVSAKHLSYIGDAHVGDGVNIGAGFITANFDGKKKNKSKIGSKSLIGSNTVLVAPAQLGERSRTGAGAVVVSGTKVKKGEVVVGVPAKPIRKGRKRG